MEHPLPKILKKAAVALNELIDYLIEDKGLHWTMEYLIENCGWTEKELLEMQFSEADIEAVYEKIAESKEEDNEEDDEG